MYLFRAVRSMNPSSNPHCSFMLRLWSIFHLANLPHHCLRLKFNLKTELTNDVWPPVRAVLQEDSSPLSPTPSSGQKLSYQTDPRPHFGVAWSSHSTCRPLWGSEGPCWGQRNQDMPDQTHACPHCHLEMPPDTLRWHEVGTEACKHTQGINGHTHTQTVSTKQRASDCFLSLCTGKVSSVWRGEEPKDVNGVNSKHVVTLYKWYRLLWMPSEDTSHLKVMYSSHLCSLKTLFTPKFILFHFECMFNFCDIFNDVLLQIKACLKC